MGFSSPPAVLHARIAGTEARDSGLATVRALFSSAAAKLLLFAVYTGNYLSRRVTGAASLTRGEGEGYRERAEHRLGGCSRVWLITRLAVHLISSLYAGR